VQSGARKFAEGLTGAAKASSDLGESLNKSNAVFKESGAEIQRWASGAAKSFGQSKTQALDAAGAFGNMFSQLGVGSQEAAKMSMGITELASDFASFHNADITEVLTAQQAAFRGEYDALQRFLPLINAASVEQEAMAKTGKANAKELTAQEKALAVYRLMLKGAGEAQGDFKRTAEGAANQQRILKATQEDLAASMGAKLLPVQIAVNKALLDLPGPLQAGAFAAGKFAPEMIALAGALGQAALAARAFSTASTGASLSSAGAAAGALGWIKVLGPLGLGIAAAFGLQQASNKVFGDGTKVVMSLAEAEARLTSAHGLERDVLEKYVGKLREGGTEQEKMAKAVQESARVSGLLAKETDKVATAEAEAKRKAGDFSQTLKDVTKDSSDLNRSLSDTQRALQGFARIPTPETAELEAKIARIDFVLSSLRAKQAEHVQSPALTEDFTKEIERHEKLRDVMAAQHDVLLKSRDATIATAGAKIAATKAAEGLLTPESQLKPIILGAAQALSGQTKAAQEAVQPIGDLAEATKPLPGIMEKAAHWAPNLAKGLDWAGDEAGQAARNFFRARKELEDLIAVSGQAGDFGPGSEGLTGVMGRASGGPASGWTLVGERGAELVRLPTGSQVFSHEQSRQMARGGPSPVEINIIGGVTVNNVGGQQDTQQTISTLGYMMAWQARSRGVMLP
jgi:hypothetical protein